MKPLLQIIRNNSLSIISLLVAFSALGYNTYRNELTEENRNIRYAGFELMKALNKLQLSIDYAHYEKNRTQGHSITGWGQVLYIGDMGELISDKVALQAQQLKKVWGNEWRTIEAEVESNQRVTGEIQVLRQLVSETMRSLD